MAGACDSGSRQKHLIRNSLITRNIMAIEQRIVNDSLTEIYVIGGSNFITQSRPTNFHQFFTRKILTPTEDISDFREVTAAERTALEQADALWEEPSARMIAEWNHRFTIEAPCFGLRRVSFGRYNADTGYFEGNGLTDITTAQARLILESYIDYRADRCRIVGDPLRLRTVAPVPSTGHYASRTFTDFAKGFLKLEAVTICSYQGSMHANGAFNGCSSLRTINVYYGPTPYDNLLLCCWSTCDVNTFKGCTALVSVPFSTFRYPTLWLGDSPRLSDSSINSIVTNALDYDHDRTVTLHPEAYARVSDELFAQAAAKNITIAST